MSKEQLNAFLKAPRRHQPSGKVQGSSLPEAAFQIAKDAGFSITAEDVNSALKQQSEMTNAELESASGGLTLALVLNPVVLGAVTTAAIVGVQTAVNATIDAANS